MAKPRKEIKIGKEYGWLTVLSSADKDKAGHLCWNVRCRCGNEFTATTSRLAKYNSRCRKCAVSPGRKRLSDVGDVINGFEILSENGKNRYGAVLYRCRCLRCGNEAVYTRGDLTARKGNGCRNCPPDYHFQIHGSTACGELPNGTHFKIDADIVDAFSKYNWYLNSKGYIQRCNTGLPKMMLHWFVLNTDSSHEYPIDHINRDRTDCRRENLRIVTAGQNSMNRSIGRNNTTGYVGVCYVDGKNIYRAKISLNNRNINLGQSVSPVVCAQMYNLAADFLFGEYRGHINDVPCPPEELKQIIEERCQPYMAESLVATQPCGHFLCPEGESA